MWKSGRRPFFPGGAALGTGSCRREHDNRNLDAEDLRMLLDETHDGVIPGLTDTHTSGFPSRLARFPIPNAVSATRILSILFLSRSIQLEVGVVPRPELDC